MNFKDYKETKSQKFCDCGHCGCDDHEDDGCGRENRYENNCERGNWEKEYLGKSVSECKYFRVCNKRYYEAEQNNNCEHGGCHCCRCRCKCCK